MNEENGCDFNVKPKWENSRQFVVSAVCRMLFYTHLSLSMGQQISVVACKITILLLIHALHFTNLPRY